MARQKVGLALLLALFAAPLVMRFTPASAQDDDDPASKRVSLELDNQTLLDSLKLLFKSVGANYVIEPTVMKGAASVRVTLSISDQPFIEALESVLNAGSAKGTGLHYRLENGVYTITTKDGPTGVPGSAGPPPRPVRAPIGAPKSRVTLALQDKSLDESLRMLFDSANIQYVIPLRAPATGSVTMSMTNMPFEGALLGTLKAVNLNQPLGWQEMGGGIYAIVPLPGGRGFNPDSVRLSLNFNQANLREAVNALFKAAGATFTIDQGVQGVPVTLKLHDVNLRSASEMLLRSSGNPNYGVFQEVGIYRIGVKK